MKVAAIVPSLNPDDRLEKVVEGLSEAGFGRILVVDDGSDAACRHWFEKAEAHPACTVLRHEKNKGKGRALKTAFQHYLQDPGDCVGVVTVDDDGQHGLADAVRCATALEENPEKLVLGIRDFTRKNVPFRSACGNRAMRGALFLLFGLHLSDTQTGLRAIPNTFCQTLLEVDGERYEFETNMLLEAKDLHISFLEVPIETIYIDNNEGSHYHSLKDSLRIFALLAKFALSGFSSAIVDVLLFAVLNFVFGAFTASLRLFIAVGGARVVSAIYNFLVNKNYVFKSNTGYTGALLRYTGLCLAQMLCSYGGTFFFSTVVGFADIGAKIFVDAVLFFISFQIQRRWVFPRRGHRSGQ